MTVAAMLDADRRRVFRVTPAQAHAWAICGGFFRAQYRSGRSFVSTYHSLLGTSVHELVAIFDRTTSAMQHDVDGLIRHNWHAGRFAAEEDHCARIEATALLRAYATLRQTETVQILGNEVFCQTTPRTVGDEHAIVLSGRIDRVARRKDGTIELLDLKTGADLPTHDELYNNPATTIYHLLAAEQYGSSRIVVAQRSLRSGGYIEVMLDGTGVAAGKERLREMVYQLATDDFSLTPCPSCAYCPARATCPALLTADSVIERPL